MSSDEYTNIHFISAGAGSGKTYSLTQKLETLLTSGKVTPAGVIATTFTKLAAGELKERVREKLIASGQLQVANQMEQSLIGTVNGVCGELLQRFAFEAGMPPEQQVVDENQSDILFYQAMEGALKNHTTLLRQMNTTAHRLAIVDTQSKMLQWRQEVKRIADAARANNMAADAIRDLGISSADDLLKHFPKASQRDLDRQLLNAIEAAMEEIDTAIDNTKTTRDYLSLIGGVRAALYKERATWAEWISLSKKMPGAKSKAFAEPIAVIASDFAKHPALHRDIRFFSEQAFNIAADSLGAYQYIKQQKGLVDFVDQEQQLFHLLDVPSVREVLAEEIQLLLVDEFQDTSPIQLALFLKLSKLADQVIWVGDVKQSIYGFRGADPALMKAIVDRVTDAGNAPEILEQSWRSRPELVAYINDLFVPAFKETLSAEQVSLQPARPALSREPAVVLWQLAGKRKDQRAQALSTGIGQLLEAGMTVVDKHTGLQRLARYSDIAVLCRTHSNLAEVAGALSDARLPIRYKRSGLLSTPEVCLALACLRRLIDPGDTLATAEIITLGQSIHPEDWIGERMAFVSDPESIHYRWLEQEDGPVAALKLARERLPFLTPVETLRVAIDVGDVRKSVSRWGPTAQRSQHRLNNLSALLEHANEYMNQCANQNQPATAAGLVLWFHRLSEADQDTQATGGAQDAIQLVTHHGAKGLEWPIVIAMDLSAALKPRLWGLTVLASPTPIDLSDPLANRSLRYWPAFMGLQRTKVALLDQITDSDAGQDAVAREIEESKRLLYVSLTRPRETLIIAMDNEKKSGEWMDVLAAPWMLPEDNTLTLPSGTHISSLAVTLKPGEAVEPDQHFAPRWPEAITIPGVKNRLFLSPSSIAPLPSAAVGESLILGDRLDANGGYDPAALGSALHAVIASSVLGQNSTERILNSYGMENTVSVASANESVRRLIDTVEQHFRPIRYYVEYPIQYRNEKQQLIGGWIDLLLETEQGFVLIDHKASPRARSDWNEIALSYSGQLAAYATGVTQATRKPVLGCWIHFALTGGLVEVNLH